MENTKDNAESEKDDSSFSDFNISLDIQSNSSQKKRLQAYLRNADSLIDSSMKESSFK